MKVITKSPIFVNNRKVANSRFSNAEADKKKADDKKDGKKTIKITDDTLNKAGKGLDLFGKAKDIFGKGVPASTDNSIIINDTNPEKGMSKTTKVVLAVAGAALLITVIVMVSKKK